MRQIVCISLALMLAAAGDSRADTSQRNSQQTPRDQSAPTSQQRQSPKQQTISGQITGFRHIGSKTEGAGDRRSLVRLQLQDGRNVTVDIGPKKNLDRLSLQKGNQIRLNGHFADISGRQVFLANRISSGGETMNIQQSQKASGASVSGRSTSVSTTRTLSGTVQGIRHLQLRSSQGQQETHTLANIRLDNGRTTFVDLGRKSRAKALNLQRGERVRLQASEGTLDGKRILLASRLRREGQKGQAFQAARRSVRAATGEKITLQGTVQGYQIMSLGTGAQKQVLLRLDLQDGRSVLVDAGQYQQGELDLKNLNLQDRVVIEARQQGGQLIADDISFQPAEGGPSQSQQGTQSQGKAESPSEEASPEDESSSDNDNN